MVAHFERRTLLKGGLTVTAVGALGGISAGTANAAEQPRIYGTAEWDARPPNGTIVVQNHQPTYIVVHHTVDPGNTDDFSKEHAFWMARAIQDFHMDTRGWVDSGQQFTISRGGYICEGRHRSLEVLQGGTQHVQGANVGGHNSEVIGIENEGLYTEYPVPQPLWESLVDMVTYIADQYGVTPELIKGHRDFNSTQCPGNVLYGRLPELREAVGVRLGVPVNQPREWPLLRPGDSGPKVATAQRLLHEQGATEVPVNGFYGPSTQAAVHRLAERHGLSGPTCVAAARTGEQGLLGADIWPLLTAGTSTSTRDWKASLSG